MRRMVNCWFWRRGKHSFGISKGHRSGGRLCLWVSEQRGCEGRLRDGPVDKGPCIWYDDENVAPVKAPSPMPLRWAP